MRFKRHALFSTVIASVLLIPNVMFGYELGVEKKVEDEKPRVNLTADDFKYPMYSNNKISDFFTVAIYGTGAPGSGVIIAQKNNDYYVLTANHVIGEILKGDVIELQTLDGEYHDAKLLKSVNEIDGALIKFSSKNKYYKALIHPDVKPNTGTKLVTKGYALPSKEAKRGSLRESTGKVITVIDDNKDGYDLLYDAATNVGMSGGGIYTEFTYANVKGSGNSTEWLPFKKDLTDEDRKKADQLGVTVNPQGTKFNMWAMKYKEKHPCYDFSPPILLGIHGRAESYRAGGKSGASMGINIHTLLAKFASTLAKEGITSLPKERETLIWKDGCPIYEKVKNIKLGRDN